MYPIPENPKISIVIPALNEERLIGQTLVNTRRVAPEAEILVVDGASKDKTVEIAKEHAKVYSKQCNIAAARNTGAEASNADVLIFLDADTTLTRQFVDESIKILRDPKTISAGCIIMPRRFSLLAEFIFYFFNFLVMLTFFFGRPVIAGTCVAYKRTPFFEVGGFDGNMAASEDFNLCRKISKKGKVVFLRHVIVRTSRRRLEQLGLLGLISDWSRVTVQFLLGKTPREYRTFR